MKRTTIAIIAATAVAVGTGVGAAATPVATTAPQPVVAAATGLPAEVAEGLTFSREEERMARDLYRFFADRYDGDRPFSNIVDSEQRHFDAIGRLLTRYGLADPSAGRAAGRYADPAIQRLYDTWKAQGSRSLQAAFAVGVDLENRDIADLEKSAATPGLPDDVRTVYSNLLQASRNHLAAFTRAAERGSAPGQGRQGRGQGQSQSQGQRRGHHHGQGNQSSRGPGDGSCLR